MDKIKRLIVVRNKAAVRKLQGILKKLNSSINEWKATCTKGHIFRVYVRNLDPQKTIWTYRRRKYLETLKSELSWADYVYIALDSNDTGEHLALQVQDLTLECNNNANIYRIDVKEVTEKGVKEALANVRTVDEELATAERLRTELNKVLKYTLSSAAVRVFGRYVNVDHVYPYILNKILEQENKRRAYKYKPFFYVDARTYDGMRVCSRKVASYERAEYLLAQITSKKLNTDYSGQGTYILSPPGPFTFLSLVKFVCAKYKAKTYEVRIALQSLYRKGYISFYDTTSNNLSKDTVLTTWKYIKKFHNRNSIDFPRYSDKNVDEAIRPINIKITPKISNRSLKDLELLIYNDIWYGVMGFQCADAIITKQSVDYYVDDQHVLLSLSGEKIVFGGWLNIAGNLTLENKQAIKTKQCKIDSAMILSSVPKPPQRYTIASLLQMLEDEDFSDSRIYIEALERLEHYKLITVLDTGEIVPKARGEVTIKWLKEVVPYVLSYDFISKIESELYIVQRRGNYIDALEETNPIYTKLVKKLKDVDIVYSTIKCPQCYNKTQLIMDEPKKDPYVWCDNCDWWTYMTFDSKGEETVSPIFQQEVTCLFV